MTNDTMHPFCFLPYTDQVLNRKNVDADTYAGQVIAYLTYLRHHKKYPPQAMATENGTDEPLAVKPHALVSRTVYLAGSDFFFNDPQSIAVKKEMLQTMRNHFSGFVHALLDDYEQDPHHPQTVEYLDYMLCGALKNYDKTSSLADTIQQWKKERKEQEEQEERKQQEEKLKAEALHSKKKAETITTVRLPHSSFPYLSMPKETFLTYKPFIKTVRRECCSFINFMGNIAAPRQGIDAESFLQKHQSAHLVMPQDMYERLCLADTKDMPNEPENSIHIVVTSFAAELKRLTTYFKTNEMEESAKDVKAWLRMGYAEETPNSRKSFDENIKSFVQKTLYTFHSAHSDPSLMQA